MALIDVYERVKTLIPNGDERIIEQLCDDSVNQLLAYTHRTKLPVGLEKAAGDLAIVSYNRMGTEGESSRHEGGESYTFIEMPESIYRIAKTYRIARIGGHAHENVKASDGDD